VEKYTGERLVSKLEKKMRKKTGKGKLIYEEKINEE